MSALLELIAIQKTYRTEAIEVRAVRGISVTVERGEFVAIMGPSGSGKSTLMHIIGCLDQPTSGSYRLNGREVARHTADELAAVRNREIGFVFQNFQLLPRTSILENVELPLVYRGIPAHQRHEQARAALQQLGLAERERAIPQQLSGGQQQRVAIARALVTQPALLLADEPTGNLDSERSVEIMRLLQGLNRERQLTIVLITHEHDIAAFAQRLLQLKDGHVVSDAPVPSAEHRT